MMYQQAMGFSSFAEVLVIGEDVLLVTQPADTGSLR
jgi:hypothetical protein